MESLVIITFIDQIIIGSQGICYRSSECRSRGGEAAGKRDSSYFIQYPDHLQEDVLEDLVSVACYRVSVTQRHLRMEQSSPVPALSPQSAVS